MAYKHKITSPHFGEKDVPVVQRGTDYYIDAAGIPDDDSDGFVIVEVYGAVVASLAELPDANDPLAVLKFIHDKCVIGTPGTASDLHYTFRDSAGNSIPVKVLDDVNYLQVLALFKGNTPYVMADKPIKFTPTLS
jgi:hypothetical protein